MSQEVVRINKNTLWKFSLFIVIVFGGFLLNLNSSLGTNINTPQVVQPSVYSGNAQIVNFYVDGGKYVFQPSSVKLGSTIKLVADVSRMPGCSRGVISSELGISKTFTLDDNTFTFTPKKAGDFYVACSMNMYKGTLTVLNVDGSKGRYVQEAPSGGASCGSGSGGCGCGG